MANTIDFILTTAADELISKVLSGKTLNFTRMAVGDGFSYDINVAKGFKNVVNEVLSLDITKKETLSPKSVKITSAFKNTDAQKEFYYREVGLYAQDPDTGEEVLYAYGNRNDAAELITPTGSNVVTKQLVFVISVGDSAKVTFNVNADVYALQEDMLDVQADISEIQTNLGTAQTNITTLQTGLDQTNANITTIQTDLGNANTNIANMQSGKADKNLANTGMITNCLLEIPQRIKYELTSEGALTIKAGTVLIFPYGTEAPTLTIGSKFFNTSYTVIDYQYEGGKLFYWVEIPTDRVITYFNLDPNLMLAFNSSSSYAIAQSKYCTSGDTSPSALSVRQFWYDQTKNFIYNYTLNSTVPDNEVLAFPVLLVNCTAIDVFSITQAFNGLGYIGSTIWVDKGVKGLIPNGINSDGTLNVKLLETSRIFTTTTKYTAAYLRLSSGELAASDFYIADTAPTVSSYSAWYNPSTNYIYSYSNESPKWEQRNMVILGYYKRESSNITNLTIQKTFRAVNYYDYAKKIEELETRLATLEAN